MEGKEIIEKMTKGTVVIQSNEDRAFVYGLYQKGWLDRHGTPNMVNRFSLKVSDDNRMMEPFEAEANASLICEAFNVANQTGLTPSQLQSELEKAKELLKLANDCVQKWGHPRTQKLITAFLEGKQQD